MGLKNCTSECNHRWVIFLSRTSVTIFGKILPLWQNPQSLEQFFRVYELFGRLLHLLCQMLFAIGQIYADVNGQMLKNYIAIWSHCPTQTNDLPNVQLAQASDLWMPLVILLSLTLQYIIVWCPTGLVVGAVHRHLSEIVCSGWRVGQLATVQPWHWI